MSADSKLGQQQQRNKKAVPAAGNGSDASRPVLQRTQPKVNQKIPSKISLKTPTDIKKYKSQECNVVSKTSKASTELASDCCVKELESSDAIESQQQFESSGKTKEEEEISGALCTNLLDDVNGGLEVHASCSSSVGSLTDQEVLLRELSFLSTDETKKTWLNALPATVVPLIRTRTTTHGTSKAREVPPELIAPLTSCLPTKKRCGWLTSQSDPTYIAHHDNEWGVPVHDDKLLFELLVLSGVQAEFNWPLILKMRKDFRVAFAGFDPLDVACFDENKIASLRDRGILKHEWKIRDIVNNAKRCLEV
ncbi:hypothetical protein O6H91_04G086200 [Diphasiastrum complanatum]|nr:hypothetical protein O6H91_04G086200 [Diphasiastrum complanatum]